ncbi:MAG: hypothetical protein NT022_03070 [Deltaproteobacteria bacterium]|nr:hypothetical protein [Deltaproteobacteria bacterium]
MGSQKEIPCRNILHIADFHLKECILRKIAKNKSTGSNTYAFLFEVKREIFDLMSDVLLPRFKAQEK